MHAIKVMLADMSIVAYRMKRPIVQVDFVSMTDEEFAPYEAVAAPPIESIFENRAEPKK